MKPLSKSITLDDFLTPIEIKYAAELFDKMDRADTLHRFAAQYDRQIITPNIERINKKLGQENDPRYLAYAVYYVMIETSEARKG